MYEQYLKISFAPEAVHRAAGANQWDFANQVLYDLCHNHPLHNSAEVIVAKIWLIGRSYAAAIERSHARNNGLQNEDFYFQTVAPKMLAVGGTLDTKIARLKRFDTVNEECLPVLLETHAYLIRVFKEITAQDNRSLASKYLHFHLPKIFYLYDSRSIHAIRQMVIKDAALLHAVCDPACCDLEYADLAIRCYRLQQFISERYQLAMNPREIDTFLLNIQ